MRNLFIMITGFTVAGVGVMTLALALPRGTNSNQPAVSATPMAGMASMSSGTMSSASLASVKLTIQHVQRGCHVWAHGAMTGPMMRLHLRVGQRLSILDQDVDAHQMLEFAGPMRLP